MTQLSNVLDAVVAQQLVPRIGGGRYACIELMIVTSAIRSLIRDGKTHQIYSCIETGRSLGMRTMDSELVQAIKNGIITNKDACRRAVDIDNMERLLRVA